uniref:Uncharacterized protein n=1 Tax=Arundo donax TaxID=35708 RepID=A0A0A9CJE7_ARUDO
MKGRAVQYVYQTKRQI